MPSSGISASVGYPTEALIPLDGIVDGAVGQTQPSYVHPGRDHGAEGGLVLGRGSDGGDDLGTTEHGDNATRSEHQRL